MFSDEERRKIAARLRNLEIGCTGTCIPAGDLTTDILKAIGYGSSDAMTPYGLLADLIEPDTTSDTTISPELTTKCDRRALLALADEIEGPECVMRCCNDASAGIMFVALDHERIARRIREALGVTDG